MIMQIFQTVAEWRSRADLGQDAVGKKWKTTTAGNIWPLQLRSETLCVVSLEADAS